jgi:hypothetical protein
MDEWLGVDGVFGMKSRSVYPSSSTYRCCCDRNIIIVIHKYSFFFFFFFFFFCIIMTTILLQNYIKWSVMDSCNLPFLSSKSTFTPWQNFWIRFSYKANHLYFLSFLSVSSSIHWFGYQWINNCNTIFKTQSWIQRQPLHYHRLHLRYYALDT